MLRTALCTAVLAIVALTAQAQNGRKPAVSGGKAVDTAGKATIPVGPVLAGEEKLSAQERAERTFLMPPRKKMPSVQPAPAAPEATAVAIGPPTVEEMAAEEAAKAEAAAPATAPRSTTRRHHSSRRRHAAASHSSKKKSSTKKKSSSRRRR